MTINKRKINGIDLNFLIDGTEDGPPVLLLHGFPDDHNLWRYQIPALVKAGYRVIAPDTRGTGGSELLPRVSDYRLERLVADQISLLDYLGIKQVRLVAHDWGALQGWELVLRHPLFVLSPSGRTSSSSTHAQAVSLQGKITMSAISENGSPHRQRPFRSRSWAHTAPQTLRWLRSK